jgi:hypothetical protein
VPSRKVTFRLLLAAVAALVVAGLAFDAPWALRAAWALPLGALVVRWGVASMRPLQTGTKTYEPVDVVEPDGVPVYSCQECGTQVVLLRRGSDKPPRHCGEAMAFSVVPDPSVLN